MDARDIIAAARTRLCRHLVYLTQQVMALRPFALDGLGTLGVDARLRMAFDPEVVTRKLGVKYTPTIVLHESTHPLLQHFERAQALGIGPADAYTWNIAADCESNRIVLDAGYEFPPGMVPVTYESLAEHGVTRGMLAEEVFALLMQRAQGSRQSRGDEEQHKLPGCGGRCGRAAGANQGWEGGVDEDEHPGADPAQQEIVRRQVAQAVREHSRSRGTVPGGLDLWAEKLLTPPTVPWERQLSAMARNAIAQKLGMNDYTMRRPSRRYPALRQALGRHAPLLPSMISYIPRVVVVVDTSGSMGGMSPGSPLARAFSEVLGVVRAVGSPVLVLAVDAAVQAVATVASASGIEKLAVGNGGTDMVLGIKAAAEHRPDVLIVLTDGYTPWPDAAAMPPHVRLVAAVVGDEAVPDHIRNVVRVTP